MAGVKSPGCAVFRKDLVTTGSRSEESQLGGNCRSLASFGRQDWSGTRTLVVLVAIDSTANTILAAVQLTLLRLCQMPVVLGHIFLLGSLQASFSLLQTAGLLRTQRSLPDAIGDAILLPVFAAVYLIHTRMAGVNRARSAARCASSCGLGKSGANQYQASQCHA
jgi:hypothetical protein